MRWIDVENRKPTDTDIPGWKPWSTGRWETWLRKSKEYLDELKRLHEAGNIEERNRFIDANRDHWSKLKPWLSALSKGKCWFTEGRDICSHLDVEHFRPKKEAKDLDGNDRDGYWWLAFDYTNFRFAGNVPNRKKGGWFPLHKDCKCSEFDCRCEESEAHFLLDPVKQTDTELLAFDDKGNAIPAPDIDAWDTERVEESIKRLKLNEHDELPEERRKVWQKVSNAIDSYLKAKAAYKPGINPAPKETMEIHAREIQKMAKEDAELSMVAVWCVLFRNDPKLIRLIT